MTFLLQSDFSEIERELDRIADAPSMETQLKFETALAEAFADTTAKVHVITGALRGSGKTASETDDDSWQGQMTWGGPSPGFLPRPHVARRARRQRRDLRPDELEVVYAWYEKRRGQSHDFLSGQDEYTEKFKAIFEEAVKGA